MPYVTFAAKVPFQTPDVWWMVSCPLAGKEADPIASKSLPPHPPTMDTAPTEIIASAPVRIGRLR